MVERALTLDVGELFRGGLARTRLTHAQRDQLVGRGWQDCRVGPV